MKNYKKLKPKTYYTTGKKIIVLVNNNYDENVLLKEKVHKNSCGFFSLIYFVSKDYQEAVVQAPFGIDPHYIPVMDKDQQEFVEKAIRYESRRNRSPESAMREEEER
jgi:hypothetical protein